jgi:hypothetical protein
MRKRLIHFLEILFIGENGKISYTALGGLFVLILNGSIYYRWWIDGEVIPAILEWSVHLTTIFILGRAS